MHVVSSLLEILQKFGFYVKSFCLIRIQILKMTSRFAEMCNQLEKFKKKSKNGVITKILQYFQVNQLIVIHSQTELVTFLIICV